MASTPDLEDAPSVTESSYSANEIKQLAMARKTEARPLLGPGF
jgi:hypothetical protein